MSVKFLSQGLNVILYLVVPVLIELLSEFVLSTRSRRTL